MERALPRRRPQLPPRRGGFAERFADRLLGSPALYDHKNREPEASVNFVTCHDGFTLDDLVSYDRKHNESNGEGNRDGGVDDRSWNCGVEGPTDDPAVEALRARQVKNFFTVTLLSAGMPMILMGDEVRRTQTGNNNAYCHDDETSWFDWTLVPRRADLLRFVGSLNAVRVASADDHEQRRVALSQLLREANISWHGVGLHAPDWRPSSHSVAVTATFAPAGTVLHVIVNAYWEPLSFELPLDARGAVGAWRRWIDTSLESPEDIVDPERAPAISSARYRVEARSVVVLVAELERATPA